VQFIWPFHLFNFFWQFLDCLFVERENVPQSVAKLKAIFLQLPKTNQLTLLSLMDMLHRIAEHQDKTMMTAVNLAIVWAPNLLKNKNETTVSVFTETGPANLVVSMMISHFEEIFLRATTTLNHSNASHSSNNTNALPSITTNNIMPINNNFGDSDPSMQTMNIPMQHVNTNIRPRSDRRMVSPRGQHGLDYDQQQQPPLQQTQIQQQFQQPILSQEQLYGAPEQPIPQIPLATQSAQLSVSQERKVATGNATPKSPRQHVLVPTEKRMNRRAVVVSEVDIESLLDGDLSEDEEV
jgi:hypothetical protein